MNTNTATTVSSSGASTATIKTANLSDDATKPNIPLTLPQLQPNMAPQQQMLQRKRLVGERTVLGKGFKPPILNEAGDCHRAFVSTLKSLPNFGNDMNAPPSPPEGAGIGASTATTNLHRWGSLSKRMPNNSKQNNIGESDENPVDGDVEADETIRNEMLSKSTTTLPSKKSFQVFGETFYETNLKSFEFKKTPGKMFDGNDGNLSARDAMSFSNLSARSTSQVWPQETKMNFIVLLGLLIALLISKLLQYLQVYFDWFKVQVERVRLNVFGNGTFWDLLNSNDLEGHGIRMKLLLLPFIGACSILCGIVTVVHASIRFLLGQVPDVLAMFVQKLYSEI